MKMSLQMKRAAADYYEQLLFDYPNSLHAVEARRRFRAMRGDDIE